MNVQPAEPLPLREIVRERALWLLLALIVLLFIQPLTTQTFFFRDIYQHFIPKRLFMTASLRAGELPLWDPLTNGGEPYMASPAGPVLYPSTLLFLALPFREACNADLVLHVLFCALAAYWLVRTLRFSPPAAFVAGAAFALAGATLSGKNHAVYIHALPWLPLTILLAHQRRLVAAAVAAAMPLLLGVAEVEAMLIAMLLVWMIATKRLTLSKTAAIVAMAFVLALIQIVPLLQVMASSSRHARRTYESFTAWSVDPRRLPELVVPRFFGDTSALADRDYWGRERESEGFPYLVSIYLGLPLLLLAIAGAFAGGRDDFPRRTLAALALLAVALSLGRFLPLFRLFYEIPLVAIFRFPVKAMMAATLPIALLAASAVDDLRARSLAIAGAVSALVAGALAAAMMSSGFAMSFARFFFGVEASSQALAASFAHAAIAAAAFALAVWRNDARLVAAVVALDLAIAGYFVNPYAPREIFDPPPVVARVTAITQGARFWHEYQPVIEFRAPTNDVVWLARHNIAVLNGFTAPLFGIANVYHPDYDLLAPTRIAELSLRLRALPWRDRIRYFRAAGVRAFMTSDVVREPGVIEIASLRDEPLHLYAIPESSLAWFDGPCGHAQVAIRARRPSKTTYDVAAPCDGRVTFAENHYPGWIATVDGAPVELQRANYAFSAVDVRSGCHTIVRAYRPRIWFAGMAGTLAGILGCVWIGRLNGRGKRI